MAEVKLYKQDGSSAGAFELSDALFAVQVKPDVVHEAIVIQEANSRVRLAQTKDRSEVRGGGKKPWKQKGTGRARHGSRRSPIWSGGGITFGPIAARVFKKKINKKAKRKALAMMLSDKVNDSHFIVVENFDLEMPKTAEAAKMRSKLPGANESALIITASTEMNMVHSAKNLPKTATISASSLNVRDLAKYATIIASKAAVEEMTNTYL